MPRKREYVNNHRLYEEFLIYKKSLKEFEENGGTRPEIPEYIGEAILKIAENLAKKPNFSGYSFKEDMIGDGIENSLLYLNNFNPELSKNPFAYFTQIINFAFIRRIKFEAKQSYVKYKSLENSELYTNHKNETKKHINLIHTVLNDTSNNIIEKFEEGMRIKKAKTLAKNLKDNTTEISPSIIEQLMK